MLKGTGTDLQFRNQISQPNGPLGHYLFLWAENYLSPAESLSQNTQASPSSITQTQPKTHGLQAPSPTETQKKT